MSVVVIAVRQRDPRVGVIRVDRTRALEHRNRLPVWCRVGRDREALEVEGVRVGVSRSRMGGRGCACAQRRQQAVSDQGGQPITNRQRIIRPRRDRVAPEQAVAVDFDRFDRDTQLGLVRREVAGHDLPDAQLLARLLRADAAAGESPRRRHRTHGERRRPAERRRDFVGKRQSQDSRSRHRR